MDDHHQILRIAVPSDEPGGLDSARSGHFGLSPCFTIVDVVDGVVGGVRVVRKKRHRRDHGLTPILLLGQNMVDVVIVAGIGHRSLLHCLQAGMRVFNGEDREDVRSVVDAFLAADLEPVGGESMSARH